MWPRMKRMPCLLVDSPAQWRVLVSPVRAEIVEALRMLGPCSIADIAGTLDRPADSLYPHLELLEQAGLVVAAGFRKGPRNIEQLLDVVADDFAVDFTDPSGAAENQAIVDTANSFLKAAARAVRDSAAARQLQLAPGQRNVAINYELGWLTPDAFQKVRALIRELKAVLDAGKQTRAGRLYMAVVVATPVTRRRGARSRPRPAAKPKAGRKTRLPTTRQPRAISRTQRTKS